MAVSVRGILRFVWQSIAGTPRMLNAGEMAPDFEATDHHGRPIRLRDLRGKKVVLWFFPKANTSG